MAIMIPSLNGKCSLFSQLYKYRTSLPLFSIVTNLANLSFFAFTLIFRLEKFHFVIFVMIHTG